MHTIDNRGSRMTEGANIEAFDVPALESFYSFISDPVGVDLGQFQSRFKAQFRLPKIRKGSKRLLPQSGSVEKTRR